MDVLEFAPPRWLRNPHLQSTLASSALRRALVARRAAALLAASRDILVDCGEGVRLNGHYAAPPGSGQQLVLLVHGWEGSAESQYVLSLAAYLHAHGIAVFRLNLRDHGASHHLNRELFHSCRLDEVVGAVRAVQAMFPGPALSLVGYSLGGNFVLRVAVRAPAAGIVLKRVVAVCPVLDPAHTLASLERGPWFYRHYLMHKWRRSLARKREAWPDLYDFEGLLADRDLTRMTEQLVLRYTGFADLASYLQGYAIVGDALAGLAVRAQIITALDDPIIPSADLTRLAAAPQLTVSVTRYGGHCGFIERLTGPSWIDRAIHGMLLQPAGSDEPPR